MAGSSLQLPEDLGARLDEEARREGVEQSAIVRTAIVDYLERSERERSERERYVAAVVAEARSAYANPDIRDEALALARL